MKVSTKRRIEIALQIVADNGTDCALCAGCFECANCDFKRNCGDVDSEFLKDVKMWLESQGVKT